jgi:hypothetical protein
MAGMVVMARRVALAIALMSSSLLSLAPTALAAAPTNDDFTNRETLNGSLPIEVTRSNVEATKENGEFIPGLAPAGHSIWFEWEAQSTGWVTIGACKDEFPTVLAIFTGTELTHLTPVATGNADEGPDCPYRQSQYTFMAQSATKYEIAVDGCGFYLPEQAPPQTEGQVRLRIEATPPPPNDDFVHAATLVSSLEEEFEGEAFYVGQKFGYNWNATAEGGEPSLIGGPGGASVWYSWTAPISGDVRVNPELLNPGLRLGLYTGNSLEGLQLLFGGLKPYESVTFTASAGTTYRIVVYGLLEESIEPAMGNFQITISMHGPPPTDSGGDKQTQPQPPSPDTIPPDTKIFERVLKSRPPIYVFSFQSSEPNATFRCKLDKHPFVPCGSTRTFGHGYEPGLHVLRVAAVDVAGNVDPTSAVAHFRITRKPEHNKRHRKGRRAR